MLDMIEEPTYSSSRERSQENNASGRILRIGSIHVAFSERGGAERCIIDQSLYLKRNHDVSVFATYVNLRNCYSDLRSLGVQSLVGLPVPLFDLPANIAIAILLAKRYRRHFDSCDLLLSYQEPGHWVSYCSGRPYVVQIHSLPTVLYPGYWGDTFRCGTHTSRKTINAFVKFGGRRFLKQIDQTSVRGASCVLIPFGRRVSNCVHDIYGVDAHQIRYGVDFSKWSYVDPTQVLSRYSIEHPLILMVTRAVPEKRADLLIKILPEILKDHPTATLVIACAQNRHTSFLNNLARKLGVASSTRIIRVSPRELMALYCGADVFCYPTQAPELQPFSIIEAMYYGVPPVVWDNGWGSAEIVRDGTGFRARAYDVDDFADKILALLTDGDRREDIGQMAKRHVIEEFSLQTAGPALEKMLRQIVG